MLVIAAGNLEQVETLLVQHLDDLQAVFERETAFLKIRGVQFHADRKIGTHFVTHRTHTLEQQAGAIF